MDRRRVLALLASGMVTPVARPLTAAANQILAGTSTPPARGPAYQALARTVAASPARTAVLDPLEETWRLASSPAPLSVWPGPFVMEAIAHVRQEVRYLLPNGPVLNSSFWYALSLMNYVQGHVSSPNYGYWNVMAHDPTGPDPEDILAKEAGICGHAQIVFMAIGSWIGLRMRPVYVWYPEEFPGVPGTPGHATVEVSYNGTWHWFDPTWGWFFRDPAARFDQVASLIEVLQLPVATRESMRVQNEALTNTQATQNNGAFSIRATGYGFMDFAHLRVESPFGTLVYQR